MNTIAYSRFMNEFHTAIGKNNIMKALEILADYFPNNKYVAMHRGNFSALKNKYNLGMIDQREFDLEETRLRGKLLDFGEELYKETTDSNKFESRHVKSSSAEETEYVQRKPKNQSPTTNEADSFANQGFDELRGIHDFILVVACKNSPTDWENLFPEAFFSHVHIMHYKEDVPAAYASPDVIIFDDLDCPGIGNDAQMRILARSMPHANLLYYGLPGENIFKKKDAPEEDQGFAARCADANSKFTLHARLRELLEFRKIYGLPRVAGESPG